MLKSIKLSVLITVLSVTAAFAFDISKVKIISAEKLDYKDGNSTLIGNVEVQLAEYHIKAPKVFIDSDDSGRPIKARFIENVNLKSEQIEIQSPTMEIDLTSALLKCFSSETEIIKTIITDKDKHEAVVLAWYQEFNYQTGFASAHSQKIRAPNKNKILEQVIFLYDDLQVESNEIEMQVKDSKVDYAVFLGDAVAMDLNQRTEAQEIYFFPSKNLLKAERDVKVVYADAQSPAYIFADTLVYEEDKNILSAFSHVNDANAKIYRGNAYGKGRQIVLNLDDKKKPDNAILTGMAYSQIDDKGIGGHELLFDIKNQSIKTLVGRPKTLLFSKKD